RRILEPSRSSDELVGVRAQAAEARILCVHGRGQLSKRRQRLLRGAQQLQTEGAVCAGTIARQTTSLYREIVDRQGASSYAEHRRVERRNSLELPRISAAGFCAGRSDRPPTAPGGADMYAGVALAPDWSPLGARREHLHVSI